MTNVPKSIVLLDGGMGQELIHRSGKKPTPLWSTRVMLDNPELVETLHMDFIAAGAKVISLNNYSATPARLKRDASIDLFEPIHAAAIRIAHSAREKSGVDEVKIGGCLPPLVASYKPELAPSPESCLEQYRELVAIQADSVDVFFCETLATIREAKAAAIAASETDIPTIVSFTLDDDNPSTLRSGEALKDAIEVVGEVGVQAVLANCSMPETLNKAMPILTENFPKVGGYANGFQSVDALDAGGTVSGLKARKDLTPEKYADYTLGWVKMGAQIIGGCCEVGPDHIGAIKTALIESGYSVSSL